MNCRFCEAPLTHVFADLGSTPLANSFRSAAQLEEMEPFYPLRAMVCDQCFLVQLPALESPEEIFSEYPFFSSVSKAWLEHSRSYVSMISERLGLDKDSKVVEVGSNDGCLLLNFVERGIPVLGIDPAANVALVAEENGVPTQVEFFGKQTARRIRLEREMLADLIVANNVMAHVPDLNDFVAGFKELLAPTGMITVEFPHLMRLVEGNEFDTIYHEHFSYFSFLTAQRIFEAHGLRLYDVEELPTHGGSLRLYGCHKDWGDAVTERAIELAERERAAGYEEIGTYLSFQDGVRSGKWSLLELLIRMKREGKRIAAFGAPAKGNTLLNYCGICTDLIEFVVDETPYKQGRFLPGTHIPVRGFDAIREERPDLVFILPWNWRDEIAKKLSFISEWGGKFLVRTPQLEVFA